MKKEEEKAVEKEEERKRRRVWERGSPTTFCKTMVTVASDRGKEREGGPRKPVKSTTVLVCEGEQGGCQLGRGSR